MALFGWGSRQSDADPVAEDVVSVGEEEEVHTAANPYCSNLSCWCHTNVEYHAQVQQPQVTEEEIETSYSFFGLRRR